MTFSLLARDTSGAIGMVVTSSSPAVAARCVHVRCQVGAVASQNITDPRFGPMLLNALGEGRTAAEALEALVRKDATTAYRQLMVVDALGNTAGHSGANTLGRHAIAPGDGAIAGGNLLSHELVPTEMLAAFYDTAGDLEIRLLAALRAGELAGGEAGDVHSAGLAVVRDAGWPDTDLRVDWDEDPITTLENLTSRWLPQRDDYVTRGIDPSKAPSYGVPGDL